MHAPSIHLTVADESALTGSNSLLELPFTVQNADSAARRCTITVSGLPTAWYDVEPREVELEPGESAALRLTLRPPQSALGRYPFRATARSDDAIKTIATLGFTLVVGAGGAVRAYPGLVTMPQQPIAATTAATATVPAARRAFLRMLALAIPLLLVLLLLSVAVAKRSSGTGAGATTASRPVLVATAAPARPTSASHDGVAGRGTPTGTGVRGPGVGPAPVPSGQDARRTATAAGTSAAGELPPIRVVPATTSAAPSGQSVQAQATTTPVMSLSQGEQPQPTAAAASGSGDTTRAAGVVETQPPVTSAVRTQPTAPGATRTQPTALGATGAAPTTPREPSASVTPATGSRMAASPRPAITLSPTGSGHGSGASITPIHLVAAARIKHPAPRIDRAEERYSAANEAQRRGAKGRPSQQERGQRRQAQPSRARQVAGTTSQPQRHVVAREQGAQRATPRRTAPQRQPRQQPAQQGQQSHHVARRHEPSRHAEQRPQAHAPAAVNSSRTGIGLRVAWPAGAALRFDRRNVLQFSTEPGAVVTVTLRAMIRVRGVDGREIAQPYHYTAYATADRHGQAAVPLRYAYIPTHPTPGTLTIMARTAHSTLVRSASVMLTR